MRERQLIAALAHCFSTGRDAAGISEYCTRMLGRKCHWLHRVAERFIQQTAGRTRPRRRAIVEFLSNDPGVRKAFSRLSGHIRIQHRLGLEPRMQPVPAAAAWDLPAIPDSGALADWLWLEPGEVEWFADLRNLSHNYNYRLSEKRSGGTRLIESPKPRLKAVQRQILTWILDPIPIHPAAHGFVKGRSIRTFTAPHVGRATVLRMDLQNFFPSLRRSRIQSLFRTAGYPEPVADLLGGICTTVTPRAEMPDLDSRQLYSMSHLPQGAPTSPALANLCAYRLDCRLTGLAAKFGAQYTRYADDLAFSCDAEFAKRAMEIAPYVSEILQEEGFATNFHKTRLMRQGVRQYLAGLVVNRSQNIARPQFDLLKAILTNCVRLGPASQNRGAHRDFRAHLEGRVGYVESIHPEKGAKLRRLFGRISWNG